MYAKLSKCSLFEIEVHYLGHVVSNKSTKLDPEIVGAIMEWVAPKNVDEVIHFMGLEAYCRRFIGKF